MNCFQMLGQALIVKSLIITLIAWLFHTFVHWLYVSFQILCYGCSVITLWTRILHTKVSSIFMVFQVGFSRIIFVANVTLISFLTLWTVRSSVMLRETRIVAYPGTHWTFCTWLGVFSTNVTFQGLSIWSHNWSFAVAYEKYSYAFALHILRKLV